MTSNELLARLTLMGTGIHHNIHSKYWSTFILKNITITYYPKTNIWNIMLPNKNSINSFPNDTWQLIKEQLND